MQEKWLHIKTCLSLPFSSFLFTLTLQHIAEICFLAISATNFYTLFTKAYVFALQLQSPVFIFCITVVKKTPNYSALLDFAYIELNKPGTSVCDFRQRCRVTAWNVAQWIWSLIWCIKQALEISIPQPKVLLSTLESLSHQFAEIFNCNILVLEG